MADKTGQPISGIAVIGMACRFPGSSSVEEFWKNLCDGVESIRALSDEEMLAAGLDAEELTNPRHVAAAALLDGIDRFDAAFFGINAREAEVMDPQHRVFLECAWQALEDAGYDPERYDGAIGVFGGGVHGGYASKNLMPAGVFDEKSSVLQTILSNEKDYLTTRVSYKLNLRGPSYNVQSGCSTSLVAVHLACQNLLNYESDMALAGGIAIDVGRNQGYYHHEGSVMSPDGHCRAFDARAEGTVFGNGVGIVVLKRLEDALADGDTIHAVILGSATNNDGSHKVGFTAPSVTGQSKVIVEALADAGVAADTIGYVEAHGTGTTLGDPIEVEAMTRAFGASTEQTAVLRDRVGEDECRAPRRRGGHLGLHQGRALAAPRRAPADAALRNPQSEDSVRGDAVLRQRPPARMDDGNPAGLAPARRRELIRHGRDQRARRAGGGAGGASAGGIAREPAARALGAQRGGARRGGP